MLFSFLIERQKTVKCFLPESTQITKPLFMVLYRNCTPTCQKAVLRQNRKPQKSSGSKIISDCPKELFPYFLVKGHLFAILKRRVVKKYDAILQCTS